MSQDTTTPPPNAASPEKKALLAAFDTVIKTAAEEREMERLAAEARRRSRGASRLLLVVCAVILTFVLVYLYVERPEWIFPVASAESPAVRQASLRISVANAAQHIERYRHQRGQLPVTLEQAGANAAGITYQRTAAGYQLEGEGDGIRVSFTSGESLMRFIGNSFEVIARRTR